MIQGDREVCKRLYSHFEERAKCIRLHQYFNQLKAIFFLSFFYLRGAQCIIYEQNMQLEY